MFYFSDYSLDISKHKFKYSTYNLINKNDVPFDQWGKELYYLMWLLLLIMLNIKFIFNIFICIDFL